MDKLDLTVRCVTCGEILSEELDFWCENCERQLRMAQLEDDFQSDFDDDFEDDFDDDFTDEELEAMEGGDYGDDGRYDDGRFEFWDGEAFGNW